MPAAGGPKTGRRWWRRALAAIGVVAALLVVFAIVDGWRAFGARATGARRARMQASSAWGKDGFVNPQPLRNSLWGMLRGAMHVSPHVSPSGPLPVVTDARRAWDTPPATGLRVTWFGHSTTFVELDGQRILVDPIFGTRASPFGWVGPRRWFPPPVALSDMPAVDAVVISHDHYDHLDYQTIQAMKDWQTTFVVPLGLGAHLASWGVPESRIVELDWWGRTKVGANLEIVGVPARHASGRVLLDNDAKLWAGYALVGPVHRVYYSGDTGLFPAMREIGARLGPFDLAMVEVGQYDQAWPDWHLGPEQAVRAVQMVRARVFLPVHWGALALAYHSWTEPIDRALAAAAAAHLPILAPRPGQGVEPEQPPPFQKWWPDLPGRTAADDAIVSTQMN